VCFYYEVTLKRSAEALLDRFSNDNNDRDIRSLLALPRDKFVHFLDTHNSQAKQTISKLMSL